MAEHKGRSRIKPSEAFDAGLSDSSLYLLVVTVSVSVFVIELNKQLSR